MGATYRRGTAGSGRRALARRAGVGGSNWTSGGHHRQRGEHAPAGVTARKVGQAQRAVEHHPDHGDAQRPADLLAGGQHPGGRARVLGVTSGPAPSRTAGPAPSRCRTRHRQAGRQLPATSARPAAPEQASGRDDGRADREDLPAEPPGLRSAVSMRREEPAPTAANTTPDNSGDMPRPSCR